MDLGRAAYDAYRVMCEDRPLVARTPLAEWEEQSPAVRECWRGVADAVVMVLELAGQGPSVDRRTT